MDRFEDKVAVITGAAQGIGAAAAIRMSREGARVALLDLNEGAAQRIADQIVANSGKAIAVGCDVSSREQVESAIASVTENLGRLDILVSNAGVTRDNLLFKMTDEDWDLVIDTHLKGSFYCARAAQKYMVEQRYGKIILVSSRAALGNRGQTNYSAAKAGMQGMARTIAIELGPFGINVNAVAPGHIDTAMTRAVAERAGIAYEDLVENTLKMNAIKRVGTPEDVANAIAFLASDEAEYITGQILYIAGRPTV